MAKNRSSKKPAPAAKKSAPAQPAAPPAEAYDPNNDRHALREIIARHGVPDAEHRAAFDELLDDEGRAELGGKTRAPGVFREGVAWAVQIDHAFTKYPAIVKEYYSVERFTYLLDRLAALDAAIEAQHAHRDGQGTTVSTAADREAEARAARQVLISKLRGFAGRRAAERKALDEATGRTDNAVALGKSVNALAELGNSWLGRDDPRAKIQRKSAGLTKAVVDAALAAAAALTGAATAATLAGKRSSVDAPEVNVAEGSVLNEMEEALRCFDEAREATRLLPRLVPGTATRHVLGPKKTSPKEAPEPASPPATPAPG